MDNLTTIIFGIAVLIMSVVIHEFSHGWMAHQLGDPTAEQFGRLTLNPIKHLDFWGSFVVPLSLIILGSITGNPIVFGWAKPVPYNPRNLRDQKYGSAKVAFAGPASNLLVALIFGLALRFMPVGAPVVERIIPIFTFIVLINIVLAVFNLVPIPPLDGSKILFTFLPYSMRDVRVFLERYGMFILLFFIFFMVDMIFPVISGLFWLITGKILI